MRKVWSQNVVFMKNGPIQKSMEEKIFATKFLLLVHTTLGDLRGKFYYNFYEIILE